jgi:3-oxoacyl-[acyl-carrier protein] reductase
VDLHLTGKTALVTASTGGIGYQIAETLAAEGADVVVNGRTQASVDAAVAAIRTAVEAASVRRLVADAGTADGCAAIAEQFPTVDILVNNLGIYTVSTFLAATDEDWFRIFEINVMSGVRLSRHYLTGMLERNEGRIVFISSEAALAPALELPHYSATKTMELSVSRNLAELTRGSKVTVNVVMPGSTRTDGVRKFVQDLYPDLPYDDAEREYMAHNRSTSIIGRLIDPREIADTVAFVSSDRASAINGAAVRADGGIVRTVF